MKNKKQILTLKKKPVTLPSYYGSRYVFMPRKYKQDDVLVGLEKQLEEAGVKI